MIFTWKIKGFRKKEKQEVNYCYGCCLFQDQDIDNYTFQKCIENICLNNFLKNQGNNWNMRYYIKLTKKLLKNTK